MKCLFVFPNAPLSPNFSGGASRCLGSFLALSSLGVELHVLRLLDGEAAERVFLHEVDRAVETDSVRKKAASWQDVMFSSRTQSPRRMELIRQAAAHLIELSFPAVRQLRSSFAEALDRIGPDCLWTEWTLSAAVACAANCEVPWIYSHHDWIHRIQDVRRQSSTGRYYLSDRIMGSAMKRAEHRIVKRSSLVITGSATEARELNWIGRRTPHVIPTTYARLPAPPASLRAEAKARIVHLGGLNTTANHVGLTSYLNQVHDLVVTGSGDKVDRPELLIVGDASRAKKVLLDQLREKGARLVGSVFDLSSVLRQFDIAVIPYVYDTGTRTKLPLLFNHAQVVVTTRAAVAGSPEAIDGENCVVLPSLDEFPGALVDLARDADRRERLGRAAKATFDREFTLESQLGAFRRALSCLGTSLS